MKTKRNSIFRVSEAQNANIRAELQKFYAGEKSLAETRGTGFDIERFLKKDSWIERNNETIRVLKQSAGVATSIMARTSVAAGKAKKFYEYPMTSGMEGADRDLTFGATTHTDDRIKRKEASVRFIVHTKPYTIPYEDAVLDQEDGSAMAMENSFQAMDALARDVEDLCVNGGTVRGYEFEGLRSNVTGRMREASGVTISGLDYSGFETLFKKLVKLYTDRKINIASEGGLTVYMNEADYMQLLFTQVKDGYPMKILNLINETMGGVIREIIPSWSIPQNEVLGVIANRKWLVTPVAMPARHRGHVRLDPEGPFMFDVRMKWTMAIKRDFNGLTTIGHLTA